MKILTLMNTCAHRMSRDLHLTKYCEFCKNKFRGKTEKSRFCSDVCYTRDYRQKLAQGISKEELNMRLKKTCEYCNTQFIAQTSVTKYCSKLCNNKHYKEKKKSKRLEIAKEVDRKERLKKVNSKIQQNEEYLSINKTCTILGVSRGTVYNLAKKGTLTIHKLMNRSIIKRSELDAIFIIKD